MRELYDFFFHRIVLHISYKYKNSDIGEDIAQMFFVKLLKMEGVCEITNPLAWVYKICDNLAKDYFETDSRFKKTFSRDATAPSSDPLKKVIFSEYEEQLNQLDATTRQIITMKIFDGYDLKEIAEALNLRHSAVRQKYSRGIKMLK